MKNSEMVYCVECNMIMVKGNAEKVFKTGYFKTTIPLCHCMECACPESKDLDIEIVSGTQECYSDYSMPLAIMA
ncbi:hypothetical protein ASG93_25630 [Paenibacillus sp. Soil787]|nr:hypothetical protein ASG93_25630 [Paenibacillus sp. Soil787]